MEMLKVVLQSLFHSPPQLSISVADAQPYGGMVFKKIVVVEANSVKGIISLNIHVFPLLMGARLEAENNLDHDSDLQLPTRYLIMGLNVPGEARRYFIYKVSRHYLLEIPTYSPIMQFTIAIVCAVLITGATVLAHDHAEQMPLDYVKYPYQAVYPGINEGKP